MKGIGTRIQFSLLSTMISAGLWFPSNATAQQANQDRGLHVKKIEEGRPASTTPADPNQPRTYRSTNSTASSADPRKSASVSEAVIGVTLWRLQVVKAADNQGARILEHKNAKSVEWAAQRIEADAQLIEGDRIRVSIESPNTGYLYVIDREQYADGSLGDPYLIFPTTHTRGGNNSVTGGRVIEFPAQEDEPPYFVLTRSRAEHVGELLVIIVAPQPLAGLQPGSEPIKIPSEKLAAWEKDWSGATERFELEGGGGRPYSNAEKIAGESGSRMLTQADPLPQTIFRVKGNSRGPVLVKLDLRIAR
jgi:hypothetical protein